MSLRDELNEIKLMLRQILDREQVREWYDISQFAALVGKAEFTVREWCRNARLHAQKRSSGRGAHPAWVVSHEELLRFQREGLLPIRRPR